MFWYCLYIIKNCTIIYTKYLKWFVGFFAVYTYKEHQNISIPCKYHWFVFVSLFMILFVILFASYASLILLCVRARLWSRARAQRLFHSRLFVLGRLLGLLLFLLLDLLLVAPEQRWSFRDLLVCYFLVTKYCQVLFEARRSFYFFTSKIGK